MEFIIDPKSGKSLSIFGKSGKILLRNYIKEFQNSGSKSSESSKGKKVNVMSLRTTVAIMNGLILVHT